MCSGGCELCAGLSLHTAPFFMKERARATTVVGCKRTCLAPWAAVSSMGRKAPVGVLRLPVWKDTRKAGSKAICPHLIPLSHGDERTWALVTGSIRNPPPVPCNLCNLGKKISLASLQPSQNGYPTESWRVQGAVAPGGACGRSRHRALAQHAPASHQTHYGHTEARGSGST